MTVQQTRQVAQVVFVLRSGERVVIDVPESAEFTVLLKMDRREVRFEELSLDERLKEAARGYRQPRFDPPVWTVEAKGTIAAADGGRVTSYPSKGKEQR